MPYREKRIYSGAMLEIERVHCTATGRVLRGSNTGHTGGSQQKINLKNARKRLMRLMCCNFTKGDYHITLTFQQMISRDERVKEIAKFLRKLRKLCRKICGQELRYICVREDRGQRPHFHLVCGRFGCTLEQLQEMWPHGRVDMGSLDGCPDYGWLARYLTKQNDDEINRNKKRWSQSKNLIEPVVPEPKILKRKNLASRPVVPKDYYVMSAYRQATAQGYEWEYIVAIRYDRMKALPDEVVEQLAGSKTWAALADEAEF